MNSDGNMRRDRTVRGQPVDSAVLKEQFPGFAASERDFILRDGQLHRINSDGSAVNLKNWHFHKDTGEFFRITQRVDGRVLFDVENTYSKRFVGWALWKRLAWLRYGVAIMGFLFVFGIGDAWMTSDEGNKGNLEFLFWVVAAFFIPASLFFIFGVPRALQVGPEALKRAAADDFGPSTISTGPRAPAVDLSYRPNV